MRTFAYVPLFRVYRGPAMSLKGTPVGELLAAAPIALPCFLFVAHQSLPPLPICLLLIVRIVRAPPPLVPSLDSGLCLAQGCLRHSRPRWKWRVNSLQYRKGPPEYLRAKLGSTFSICRGPPDALLLGLTPLSCRPVPSRLFVHIALGRSALPRPSDPAVHWIGPACRSGSGERRRLPTQVLYVLSNSSRSSGSVP